MAREIRAAIAGVGNSASSLIQGIAYYTQEKKPVGLANKKIGPYGVQDIQIVAAFDVDKRKSEGTSLKPSSKNRTTPASSSSHPTLELRSRWHNRSMVYHQSPEKRFSSATLSRQTRPRL